MILKSIEIMESWYDMCCDGEKLIYIPPSEMI